MFGDMIDVRNLGPSGVAKEASRCNERGSTYGVAGTKTGFEEIVGTNSGFKELRGYADAGLKEMGDCSNYGSKKVGSCIDVGSKEMGDCIDHWSKEVWGCIDVGSKEIGDCTNCGDKEVGGCNDVDTNKEMGWLLIYLPFPQDVHWPHTCGNRATVLVVYLLYVVHMGDNNPSE